jgi:hypothetical protein
VDGRPSPADHWYYSGRATSRAIPETGYRAQAGLNSRVAHIHDYANGGSMATNQALYRPRLPPVRHDVAVEIKRAAVEEPTRQTVARALEHVQAKEIQTEMFHDSLVDNNAHSWHYQQRIHVPNVPGSQNNNGGAMSYNGIGGIFGVRTAPRSARARRCTCTRLSGPRLRSARCLGRGMGVTRCRCAGSSYPRGASTGRATISSTPSASSRPVRAPPARAAAADAVNRTAGARAGAARAVTDGVFVVRAQARRGPGRRRRRTGPSGTSRRLCCAARCRTRCPRRRSSITILRIRRRKPTREQPSPSTTLRVSAAMPCALLVFTDSCCLVHRPQRPVHTLMGSVHAERLADPQGSREGAAGVRGVAARPPHAGSVRRARRAVLQRQDQVQAARRASTAWKHRGSKCQRERR